MEKSENFRIFHMKNLFENFALNIPFQWNSKKFRKKISKFFEKI